jgi:hypothetical protein
VSLGVLAQAGDQARPTARIAPASSFLIVSLRLL